MHFSDKEIKMTTEKLNSKMNDPDLVDYIK